MNSSETNNNSNKIFYHGTDSKFKEYSDVETIFFVDNIDIAKTYGQHVIPAKLTMMNPIELDFDGNSTFLFMGKWYLPSELIKRLKEISLDIDKYGFWSLDNDLVNELEDFGYNDLYGTMDGVVFFNIRNSAEIFDSHHPATNYVVFNNNQIEIINHEK